MIGKHLEVFFFKRRNELGKWDNCSVIKGKIRTAMVEQGLCGFLERK